MKLYRLTSPNDGAWYFADTPAEAYDLARADGFVSSTHIQDVSKHHPEIVAAAEDAGAKGRGMKEINAYSGDEVLALITGSAPAKPELRQWRIGDRIVSY